MRGRDGLEALPHGVDECRRLVDEHLGPERGELVGDDLQVRVVQREPAVAARLGGRRFGPLIAVALVALAAVHTVTALLATVERYYS